MKRIIYTLIAMLAIASQALAADKYQIKINCGEGGTVTVSKMTGMASEGELLRLFIHPESDLWELESLTIMRANGSKIDYEDYYDPNYEAYCFTMPASNVIINAIFKRTRFAVTVNNTSEGGSAVASPDKGTPGTAVNVHTDARYGYYASAVQVTEDLFGKSIGVMSVSDNDWQFTLGDDDVTVTPVFEKLPFIEIEKGSHKNGDFTVTDHEYWGETVQIFPTPDTGYMVDVVTVSYVPSTGGEMQSFEAKLSTAGDGSYAFVMPKCSSVEVSVKFKKADYYVVIDSSIEHGTVTKLSDATTHQYGDFITLSVAADEDYVLKRLWMTDAEGNDVTFSWQMKGKLLTFVMPAGNVKVYAQFRSAVFDLEILTDEFCSVVASKEKVRPGDVVALAIVPNMGYMVSELSVEAGYNITGGSVPHAPKRAPGLWHKQADISVEEVSVFDYHFVVPETLDDDLSAGYLDDTRFRVTVACKNAGPRVIWCEDIQTLYFDYEVRPDSEPKAGDDYEGHTITEVWVGDNALPRRPYVPWWNTTSVRENVTRVVFTPSFSYARPKSCYWWFFKFKDLSEIEGLENLNTSETTSLKSMFEECWSLKTIDVNTFELTNVTDVSRMFFDCFNLTTIWCNHTWNVETSTSMFIYCSELKGAVRYDISRVDCAMANPDTGYFTAFPTIELKDLEDNSAVIANNVGKKVNVKYDRVLRAIDNGDGTWTSKAYTVCLPFDLDLSELRDAGKIQVCKLYYIQYPSEEEANDGKRYEFIFSNTLARLQAGKGYLIIVREGEVELNGDGVIIKNEEQEESVDRWGYLGENLGKWRGSLRNRSNQECTENLVYTMSNDGDFRRISNTTERERGAWMAAFRAAFFANEFKGRNRFYTSFKMWVQGDGEDGEDPIVTLDADSFEADSDFSGYIDDDEVVGIREIVNGKSANGKLFDLQGRQLNGRPLGKGIYINNGKKVISK